jgi:hypothetical protein
MATIYRVSVKSTHALQPGNTTDWNREVLYCGTDRDEARAAYHASTPGDYNRGHGNGVRKTVSEVIEDAETDDFDDDVTEEE